jgi:phosphoribosylaminoimidazole (AIR) synthetase
MRTIQDEINEVSELPEYYDKHTTDIEVVPTHVVKKWIKQSVHSEVHKLSRIMGREFGENVENFLKQYATKINNDFNNPQK